MTRVKPAAEVVCRRLDVRREETMFEIIIDNELRLRSLREDDAEELFRLVDSNRQHLREWLPWLDANTTSEHSQQFIQSVLHQDDRKEGFIRAVIFRGHMAGLVGCNLIRWKNKSAEIGYWLSQEAVGYGIMTRCCRVLVNDAFQTLGLNRVSISIATGNCKSRAIPERLGFKREGIIRDAEWLYDHFVDHVLYAVLKRDWDGGQCAKANGDSPRC